MQRRNILECYKIEVFDNSGDHWSPMAMVHKVVRHCRDKDILFNIITQGQLCHQPINRPHTPGSISAVFYIVANINLCGDFKEEQWGAFVPFLHLWVIQYASLLEFLNH